MTGQEFIWCEKYRKVQNPIVSDILPNHPLDNIMVRTNDPFGGDTLLGYCSWDGNNLTSNDRTEYDLEEQVMKYVWNNNNLTYWIHSTWETIHE